ncbi:PGF-pre-PGF domain-containing protein [Archaeoglobus profundus]|uniref:PGF-pre-PGF domain-containing protein n=1 Tax=Archaeoglobus profundus (strain DSM 5631 / JCM 9629 / NBRC 100127 / Av18) TaxID=572546 RepID=D2RI95_ARCPA|nr:PGF-pre-PGF domain-containing protein [Archaeoglobus profundus]ADB58020.1 hypothetical protein Arcpr_0959 [Archaeoglobus profundus DSM 5631]
MKVVGIDFKGIRGHDWRIYYVKEVVECDTNGIPTTVDAILDNPNNYRFKLLNISTHYRAISLMFYSEKQSRALPVTIGYVSDHERTLRGFLEDADELSSKLEKSKFDRDAIDRILNVKRGIGVFRIKPNYWIDADCHIKAILLGADDFKAYMTLIDASELINVAIPKNAKVVLLEVDRIIKASPTTIYELKTSDLRGKHVVFECVGDGFNVSVKKSLEKVALYLDPEVAMAVKSNPIDTIVQAEVFWYPLIPELKELNKHSILAVGILGSDKVPKSAIEPSGDLGKVLKVYAYIPKNRDVVIIEDKKIVSYVNPSKVTGELKDRLDELKEEITNEIVQRITSKPKIVRILPVIEPGKPTTIRIGGIVDSIKLKVKSKVENVAVNVKKLQELPKNVPKLNFKVYAYLEINVNISANNIEEATISFKVDKSWLRENGLKARDIVLMKFLNGRWIQLETSVVGEDDHYVYYEAKTTSFSIYAIATKTTSPTTVSTTQTVAKTTTSEITPTQTETTTVVGITTAKVATTQKTPGFELGITLICIAIALYLRKL